LRYGVQYHFHNNGYRSFEDFVADQPSKKRTQLRRESRQPELDGVTIETLPADGYTPDVVATMYRIYLTTVDKFTWGRRYLTPRFFELVATRFAHRLAWVVARHDGKIIAGAFNVQKGATLYGRYWGTFVEQPFLHFNVCYYHGIRECIRHGWQLFEPGAGGEHKRARGFQPSLTYSVHHLENRQLHGLIGPFLERERAAVQAYTEED
jgi:predicted N-acyltransferase